MVARSVSSSRENIDISGETESESYIKKIIDALDIEDIMDKMPNELSGGQQQTVPLQVH